MTGEITLQGRVLPVGGIKEKILAGVAYGLRHVIIPWQNSRDLEEVPKDLLRKITVHPVRHYDEVLPIVFGLDTEGGGSGTRTKRGDSKTAKTETETGVAAAPEKAARKPRRKPASEAGRNAEM